MSHALRLSLGHFTIENVFYHGVNTKPIFDAILAHKQPVCVKLLMSSPTSEPHQSMASKKKSSRALIPTKARALSAKEFFDLADVPPEIEWFANITNPQTRRAYQNDLKDFMRFARISNPEVFRVVTRAHLIAWRKDIGGEGMRRVHDSPQTLGGLVAV